MEQNVAIDDLLTQEIKEQFYEKTLAATQFEGQQYGLPITYNSPAMIYNKKLISEPPKTTQKLIALAENYNSPAEERYAFAYRYDDVYFHSMIFNSFGGEIFTFKESLQPNLNSPPFHQAFETQ